MSDQRQQSVNKPNATRVPRHLRASDFILRRARKNDCRLLWEWTNDPATRAVSFSPDPILWEKHVQWFAERVKSPACLLYIAENGGGTPIGQIRYELKGREAVVSLSLAPSARGKGAGSALIARGAEQFFVESDAELIHAYIKADNLASARAFKKADFKDAGVMNVRGQQARHFVLQRAMV